MSQPITESVVKAVSTESPSVYDGRKRWRRFLGLVCLELILTGLLWLPLLQATPAKALPETIGAEPTVDLPVAGQANGNSFDPTIQPPAAPSLQSTAVLTVAIVSSPLAPLDGNNVSGGPRVLAVEAVVTRVWV